MTQSDGAVSFRFTSRALTSSNPRAAHVQTSSPLGRRRNMSYMGVKSIEVTSTNRQGAGVFTAARTVKTPAVCMSLRLRFVMRRSGIEYRGHLLSRGWNRHRVTEHDILRWNLLTVNSLVSVAVRAHRRTLERDAGKNTASSRIAQNLSTQASIGFGRSIAAHRSRCHRRVAAKLHFAGEDAVRSAVVHHQ